MKSLLFLCALLPAAFALYEGESVLRCSINSPQEAALMRAIIEADHTIDMWSHGVPERGAVDVRVNAAQSALLSSHFDCSVHIESVERLIREETESRSRGIRGGFFDDYHRFDEIVGYTKELADRYPKLTKLIPSMGKSVEGRDMPVLVFSGSLSNSTRAKWTVYLEGGIHAREWISPATSMYVVEQLLENYEKDEEITRFLNAIEFHYSPVVNPDGYEYSHTNNRMWRKNRAKNSDGSYGVDLNRNFNSHWGEAGTSKTPSSDTYGGTSPASEPEIQAIQKYVESLPNKLSGIDFHSYGQLILRSWGFTTVSHPNEKWLKELGDGIRDTIKKVSGQGYTSETGADLYPASGAADDWMTEAGMPGHGWTIELRDTGFYGFALPAKQIVPTGQEITEGVRFYLRFLLDKFGASPTEFVSRIA